MKKFAYNYFEKYLKYLNDNNLYPKVHKIKGPSTSPSINIDGKKYLTFCSNNYLGIANESSINNETKKAIDIYGTGSGSTRLLSGGLDIQEKFENALAKYFGFDDSITFSSGYLANAGAIRMLVDNFPYFQIPKQPNQFDQNDGIIISDELNHASIIDGIRLAKSARVVYKHNDMNDLEMHLKKAKKKRKLIITDGVFSMDGEIANLRKISKLSKMYGALVFVDDSHAVGVLGPKGAGTAHFLGVEKDIDVLMGSFTKAFGSIGGFITANTIATKYLRITARSYIFSDPIPPALVYGLLRTIKVISGGDALRKKVSENGIRLRAGLKRSGFKVLGDLTPIVPLLIGNETDAIKFAAYLDGYSILAPCIRKPAVQSGGERIRFSVMASHSFAQIDMLLNICSDIGKKLKII